MLYFIIYCCGFIAGIAGFVTFVLAILGYQKFSGVKESTKGAVIAIIISVIMIFLGEYLGVAYEIYNAYKSTFSISFMDAVQSVPEFLKEQEVMIAVIRDLAIAYILGGVASFSTIKKSFK